MVFDFTSDYNATFNCTLYIDGISNATNSSVKNATSTTFLANFSSDGFYQWYINCTDSNYTNQSEIRYITIDNSTVPTAVQGQSPVNHYNSTSSSVTFDMKCYDNAAVSVIQFWSDFNGAWAVNYTSTASNNTWVNLSVPGILDGTYSWAVWCNDSVAMTNMTQNRTLNVNSAPSVTLDNPTSYQNISATSLYLNCTASDSGSLYNLTMFSWFSNGTSFANNTYNVSGLSNYSNFSITAVTNYSYIWTCVACDNGSACTTASNSTFIIDTNAPTVTLESPGNGGTVTSARPTLEYTVAHYRAIKNCSLWLDDTFRVQDTDAAVGDNSVTVNSPSLADGLTYDWKIECFDNAGNKAYSEEWSFLVDTGGGGSGGGGGDNDEETTVNVTSAQANAKLAGNVSQGDKTMTGLVKGDIVNFTLGSTAHSLTIINVTSNYTAIGIRSTLITTFIDAGKTKNFDLDGNGMNDFAITVQGISALHKINIILKSLKETPINVTNATALTGNQGNASSGEFNPFKSIKWDSIGNFFKKYWYVILIVLIVAAAVVLGIVFRDKIFKSNKYWWRKGARVRLK